MTSMSSLAQRSTVRDRANGRGASTFAALDIGSSKVTCMIARRGESTHSRMLLLTGQVNCSPFNGSRMRPLAKEEAA